MPNRILRDWTDSFTMDSLDAHTERFFVRLIMKVDDYGCFYSDTRLIKANLFPLKPDVRETDISRWLTACEKSGLVTLYNVANKGYLQITNFKQVLRQKNKKYPLPTECESSDTHMQSNCFLETKRKETEVEVEKSSPPPLISDPLNQFQILPLLECAKKYFNSSQYQMARELLCINGHIGSIDGLKSICKEFIQHCQLEGKIERTVDEFAKHFRFWVLDPKRKSNEKLSQNGKPIDQKVLKQLEDARNNSGKGSP